MNFEKLQQAADEAGMTLVTIDFGDDDDRDTEPMPQRISRSLQEILNSERVGAPITREEKADLLRVEKGDEWADTAEELLASIPSNVAPATALYVLATALVRVASSIGKEMGQERAQTIGGLAVPALFVSLSSAEAAETFLRSSNIVFETIEQLERLHADPLSRLEDLLRSVGIRL